MKALHRIFLCLTPAIIIVAFLLMPCQSLALRPLGDEDLIKHSPETVQKQSDSGSDSQLTPINDTQLDALSPSLTAPEKEKKTSSQNPVIVDQKFQNSVCFKRCHSVSDFHPGDHTVRQWRRLIEDNGHALFEEIPWESQKEKEELLNYFLENAKSTSPSPAGIGVW